MPRSIFGNKKVNPENSSSSYYCCCSYFFRHDRKITITDIERYLTQRQLQAAPGGNEKYAQAIFETINISQYLGKKSWKEITDVVDKFNDLFSRTLLPFSDWRIESENNIFHFLNESIIQELKLKIDEKLQQHIIEERLMSRKRPIGESASADYTFSNILKAFHDVYIRMNRNRGESNLIYHTSRHASEVAIDIHTLFSLQQFESLQSMHLIMLLCGLYHDAKFSRQRIDDEIGSAAILIELLKPVLNQLDNEDERKVMRDLLTFIIVGGSTPTFFKTNKNKEPLLVVESISEVANNLLATKSDPNIHQESYKAVDNLAELMSNVDFLRTSISELHQNKPSYDSADWNVLEKFYGDVDPNCSRRTLQLRLTQGLRMINEMIAKLEPEYSLTRLLVRNQELEDAANTLPTYSTMTESEITITELDIQRLAREIKYVAEHDPEFDETAPPKEDSFKEIKFAQRMSNSYNPERHRLYTLTNTWPEHIKVLDALYHFLMNNEVALEDKKQVFVAIARVASEQDGCQHSAENIKQIAHAVSEKNKMNKEQREDLKNSSSHSSSSYRLRSTRITSIQVAPLELDHDESIRNGVQISSRRK